MRGRRRPGLWWLALSSLAISIAAPLPYFLSSLADQAGDDSPIAANYADRPGWLQVIFYVHVTFGGLALLLSPLQLSDRIRRRRPVAHRVVGRVTGLSMLVAAAAGLVLAPNSVAGWVGTFGFGILAVAWFTATILLVSTARAGALAAHRRWALRAFALTYAAVTLRLWLGLLIGIQAGAMGVDQDLAFDRAYHLVPFLCWVPNVIAAEWWLGRRTSRAKQITVAAS